MMARRRAKGLSERQKRILEVLDQFQGRFGYPPSIREICDQTGIPSTSVVNYYLVQLEEMGFIERDNHVSRGIRLVKLPEELGSVMVSAFKQSTRALKDKLEELLQIPIVGRIQAGEPINIPGGSDFSRFDPDHAVSVAVSLLPRREKTADLFALEVRGDSMIDAMVNDGDIVIMKPVTEARNGEMVAIWLTDRDETTLKYFYLENGRVRLQPANPNYEPIMIDDPSVLDIQGKVVMVIRQFKGQPM